MEVNGLHIEGDPAVAGKLPLDISSGYGKTSMIFTGPIKPEGSKGESAL